MTTDAPVRLLSLPVVTLTAVTAVLATDDFMIAGVLPAIADDLAAPPAAVGQLVTLYAVAYALGAPLLARVTARRAARNVLVVGLMVFAVANVAAAVAPSVEALLGLRVLAGASAAAAGPAALALAAGIAAPQQRASVLGVVGSGLALGLAGGVPLGTLLSTTVGWRGLFWTMAATGSLLAVAVGVLWRGAATVDPDPVRSRATGVVPGLAVLVVVMAATMAVYTYLGVIAAEASIVTSTGLAGLLLLAGVTGIVGGVAGGRRADARGPRAAVLAVLGGLGAVLALLAVVTSIGAPWPVLALLVVVLGFTAFGTTPAVQAHLTRGRTPSETTAVLAWATAAGYLGAALGGMLGGVALETARRPAAVPVVAVVLVVVGMLVVIVGWRHGDADR